MCVYGCMGMCVGMWVVYVCVCLRKCISVCFNNSEINVCLIRIYHLFFLYNVIMIVMESLHEQNM